MFLALQATQDEVIVFSWQEYSAKEAADAAIKEMMSDPRMKADDHRDDGTRLPPLATLAGGLLSLSVVMLLQTILLWQLASVAVANPALVRPMILTFLLASIVGGIVTWKFLFPIPAIFGAAVTLCLAAAFFSAGR